MAIPHVLIVVDKHVVETEMLDLWLILDFAGVTDDSVLWVVVSPVFEFFSIAIFLLDLFDFEHV